MSLPINSALYYPTIEFHDYRWLLTASLIWDKIYRIQPDNFTPNEPDNIKIICEDGDIGIALPPKEYAKEVALEFIANVDNSKWKAAALEKKQVKEYTRIHQEKIDVQIRQMLIAKGANPNEEWLYVPDDFAALYMTYLARKMAQKNSLQVVSDKNAAWAALTYFASGEIDTEAETVKSPFALATLMIGNYLPANITDITPKALTEFRRKYPEERRNFMRAIKEAANQLTNCHDAKVMKDIVHSIQVDIDKAAKEYKETLASLRIKSFVGFKTLTVPISTSVLSSIMPQMVTTESIILSAASLAIGIIAGVSKIKQEGQRLSRESDYSYLVHAEKAFPNTSDEITLLRSLHYDLNQFIND
jgi:hypothetical protein